MTALEEIREIKAGFLRFHSDVCGKIALYGSFAFFFLNLSVPILSVVLEPSAPKGEHYKVEGAFKIPCKDGATYAYGYMVLVTVDGQHPFRRIACRDLLHGGWRWKR